MTNDIISRIGLVFLVSTLHGLAAAPEPPAYPTIGSLESLDPAFNQLVPPTAKIERLAQGFKWAEGPVWVAQGKCLFFSDVPQNVIYQWDPKHDVSVYMKRSGYTGSAKRGGEAGSNGLTLDRQGRLVMCEHGNRRVTRLELTGRKSVVAEYYLYRRFNSPNDVVFKSDGACYFTDPPYGLEKQNADPNKELLFSGVYRVYKGKVDLLTSELAFPNGLAFSPDEKILYVANSDPARPVIMAYPVKQNGLLEPGTVFFDATDLAKTRKGLPDGLKVDLKGNLFATGPGGVLVISPAGKHLGTILTEDLTSNCAWGDHGAELYMTVNDKLCRIKTTTRGEIP
jgi:gluconolactonase